VVGATSSESFYTGCTTELEKLPVGRGSRSDRPRYYAHKRWTPCWLLASAASTERLASLMIMSQLMMSQWKPTTMAISQYSSDAAVNTRIAHTFLHRPLTLTYDPDFQSPGELWSLLIHMQKIKVKFLKGQLTQKIRCKTTERRTRPIALLFPLTRSVTSRPLTAHTQFSQRRLSPVLAVAATEGYRMGWGASCGRSK